MFKTVFKALESMVKAGEWLSEKEASTYLGLSRRLRIQPLDLSYLGY